MKYLATYDFSRMSAADKQSFLKGFELGAKKTLANTILWECRLSEEGKQQAVILFEMEDLHGFAFAAGFGRGVTQNLLEMPLGFGASQRTRKH